MTSIIKELHDTIKYLLTSDSKIKELVKVVSNTESNKQVTPCIIFKIKNTMIDDHLTLSCQAWFSFSIISKDIDKIYDILDVLSPLIKAQNIKFKNYETTTLLSENVTFTPSENSAAYKITLHYHIYLQHTNPQNINLEIIKE